MNRCLPRIASFLLVFSVGTAPFALSADPATFDPRLLDGFLARSLGPANMGGRVVGLAVVESAPTTYFVATATGGLWKTVNNGTTWTPLFDQQDVVSLGAVAVAPSNAQIVWVGT